ncbi:MAG: YdcF family protein [Clostridia bacterium]|nr:YdcF family protein [Clostridia bacterium]
MKKERIIYLIITILFILASVTILHNTDMSDNVMLSKAIQVIIILFLIRISYGCAAFIRRQYREQKYSYGIVMNLGLLIFININILRQINLLIQNWKILSIVDIYNNTLESFSFFAMLTLPCIAIMAIYCIITNIILIKKEGFTYRNLLGVFVGFFVILGLFGSQGVYMLTSHLLKGHSLMIVKKLFDVMINVILSYFYTLMLATVYCNARAGGHTPAYDKDYVIILGCMVRKDGSLPPLLRGRVDRAIDFAEKQKENTGKEVIFVPSGGKGSDETIAEADAMKNYLIGRGIGEERIRPENKSLNTYENMNFSKKIIDAGKDDTKIGFSTTNFHVFRSGVIANDCGIDCEGMGSKTKWYFYTNALIREFIANLASEKKKHIALITMMSLSSIALVVIGCVYQLIRF